jgi:hypothetical protein
MLINKSKVADIIHASGKRMSKGAWQALDAKILVLINTAIKRSASFKTITETEIMMGGEK